MKLAFVYTVAVVLIIFIGLIKRKLHMFENLLLLLALEIVIPCYTSILTNDFHVWKISNDLLDYIIWTLFILSVIPLLYVMYFNLCSKSHFQKILQIILLIGLNIGFEVLLVYWKVIVYEDWSYWKSVIVYSLLLLLCNFIIKKFRYLLDKEGC